VSDCPGITLVSLTNFWIPKSGLIRGTVIYAGSDISSHAYVSVAVFGIRHAAIFASICVTISSSDGVLIPAGRVSGNT
jgi:hypothetical protein